MPASVTIFIALSDVGGRDGKFGGYLVQGSLGGGKSELILE